MSPLGVGRPHARRRPLPFLTKVSLAVIYVVWGVNFMAVDIAVRDLSPAAMMGVRFTIAGALLLPIGRRLAPPSTDQRAAWREAIGTSLPLFVGGSGLLAWGQVHLESSMAAVVIATIPLWLITFDLAGRRLAATPRVVIAPVAGIGGVAVIANPDVVQPVSLLGLGLILGAALCWAVGSRSSRAAKATNVVERTAMQMTAGGLALLGVATALALLGHGPGRLTAEGLAATAWLIVVSSMVGFTAYTYALRHAPITAVAAYPYVNTLIAVALGVIVLGEPMTASRATGSALVLLAVAALTNIRRTSPGTARP